MGEKHPGGGGRRRRAVVDGTHLGDIVESRDSHGVSVHILAGCTGGPFDPSGAEAEESWLKISRGIFDCQKYHRLLGSWELYVGRSLHVQCLDCRTLLTSSETRCREILDGEGERNILSLWR